MRMRNGTLEVPASLTDVREASLKLAEMKGKGDIPGGPLLKIHGTGVSFPVAAVIIKAIAAMYSCIAIHDGNDGYVICISTDPLWKVGETLHEEQE